MTGVAWVARVTGGGRLDENPERGRRAGGDVHYSATINATISGDYEPLQGQFTGTVTYSLSSSSPVLDQALPTETEWSGAVAQRGDAICAFGSTPSVQIGFADLPLPGISLTYLLED